MALDEPVPDRGLEVAEVLRRRRLPDPACGGRGGDRATRGDLDQEPQPEWIDHALQVIDRAALHASAALHARVNAKGGREMGGSRGVSIPWKPGGFPVD